MRRSMKRFLGLALALLLALSSTGALAEFSPRLNALKEKEGMTIEITGTYDNWGKLSKQSLETVNGWLAPLKLSVSGRLGGAMAAASVTRNDVEVLSVVSRAQEEDTVTAFSPSGNSYLTGAGQKTPLALLTGEEAHLFDPLEIPALYEKLAKALYPVLESKTTAKPKKARTTVKNAAASTNYVDYVFKAGALNEAWPEILSAVQPVLDEALADQPGRRAEIEKLLQEVTFSGECRFKRLLDKDKADMGLQFTGTAARGEDTRKVTVFGGYTADKGGYLSVKLPQVKGKNNLTFQLSVSATKNKTGAARSLKVDASYSRAYNGEKEAATVNGTLKNAVKNSDEKWTGKLTVTQTKDKVKTTYILTPDLAFTDAGLAGKVAVQRRVGGKPDMKATLQVTVKEAQEAAAASEAGESKDLRDLSESQAKAAVLPEMLELSQLVAGLMSSLTEEERALLTHELRTDAWMTDAGAAEAAEPDEDENADEDAEDAEDAENAEDAAEDAEDKEETKAAPEENWEDADDGEEWPAVGDNTQKKEEKPAEEEKPETKEQTKDASEDGDDGELGDDWFGDDWFGDDDAGEGEDDE